jgi:hypothetical protein
MREATRRKYLPSPIDLDLGLSAGAAWRRRALTVGALLAGADTPRGIVAHVRRSALARARVVGEPDAAEFRELARALDRDRKSALAAARLDLLRWRVTGGLK